MIPLPMEYKWEFPFLLPLSGLYTISSLIDFPWRNTRIGRGSSLNPITALRLTSFQADKRNPTATIDYPTTGPKA